MSPFRLFLVCAALTYLTACTNCTDTIDDAKVKTAWQQYDEASRANNLDQTLAIIDNLESLKGIITPRANYLRAIAYDRAWLMQLAEHYFKSAYEGFSTDPSQSWYDYTDAGYRWACLRASRGDTEGALDITSKLLMQADGNKAFPIGVKSALLMLLAEKQVELHQYDEARRNCQLAYQAQLQATSKNASERVNLAIACMSISVNYFNMGDIDQAQQWLLQCEQELNRYEQGGPDSMFIEEWKGHIALKRAFYLYKTGRPTEAAATFAAVPRSRIFNPSGYLEAADYLMAAGRYNEAVHWYEQLDSTYMATDGAQMNFDNIVKRLAPRYTAYRKAGCQAEALATADSIRATLDSALIWQKRNNAAELSVIYQTNERDLRITDLRFTVLLHRIMAVALAVILLLIGYLFWRTRKYNKVLAAKNRKLYEQIQQREQAEQQAEASVSAPNSEPLSANMQIYNRLCELMKQSDVYTTPDTNHETLARLLGTNTTYLYTALRECAGLTPADFINRYRIRHAAKLLTQTDTPVGLIIEQCGITNRSTFNRLFREQYSMSPSEFRKAAIQA